MMVEVSSENREVGFICIHSAAAAAAAAATLVCCCTPVVAAAAVLQLPDAVRHRWCAGWPKLLLAH